MSNSVDAMRLEDLRNQVREFVDHVRDRKEKGQGPLAVETEVNEFILRVRIRPCCASFRDEEHMLDCYTREDEVI